MATQVIDYRLEIDNEKCKAETYFPGITYDDFDRAGGVCPWKILRIFEAGRTVPFIQGNFLGHNELRSENFALFSLGGDYYFDPCLWEAVRKFQYFPYKVSIELINIGQTSITIREILTNLLDQKEVASFYGKMVYVDRRAKRPQALPYWHRMKYRNIESPDRVRIDSAVTAVPQNAFTVKKQVAASDTDHNWHTNHATYVRFCLDAAESATRAKVLKRLTSDICLYPILKMSVAYRRETLVGDELTVSLWEDDVSPSMLHFVIHCKDVAVFVATMTFKSTPCSKL